jgi:hypothetical protein
MVRFHSGSDRRGNLRHIPRCFTFETTVHAFSDLMALSDEQYAKDRAEFLAWVGANIRSTNTRRLREGLHADSIAVNLGAAIPNQYTASLLGPSGQLVYDRFGRVYFAGGGNLGKSLLFFPPASSAAPSLVTGLLDPRP